MTYTCPKGHASSEADFCSECGARIGAPTASAPAINLTLTEVAIPKGVDICPDCATPRTPGGRFCEVCQYDFVNRCSRGSAVPVAPAAAAAPAPSVAPAAPATIAPAAVPAVATPAAPVSPAPLTAPTPTVVDAEPILQTAVRLKAVVMVDATLVDDPNAGDPVPVDRPNRVFPLDLDENLVGRRSDAKKIYPEVEIADSGVSHRHCQLLRQPDGGFAVLELGSANGTKLNGKPLEPGVLLPVQAGDDLVLGMWTRIKIQARG